MDEKIEYSVINDLRTETVSQQEDVSIATYEETVSHVMHMEKQVSFSSEDEKLIFTSTPGIPGCVDEEYKSVNSSDSGQNLRERRKACRRVHYSSDLDESNHISFEGIKRSKKRRMSLLQSLSTKEIDSEEVNLDTLENHLFPDISFSDSEMAYYESCFNTSTTNTDITWSKLQGVAYSSKYDFSGEELDVNRAINHPNRSFYRQKRREWYLNRRNGERAIYSSWWYRYIKLFIQIIFAAISRIFKVTRKITRYMHRGLIYILKSSYRIFRIAFLPVIFLLQQISFIFTSIKTKLFSTSSRLFISSSKESVDVLSCQADKGKRSLLCSYFCCYFLLLFALMSVILIGYYDGDGLSDVIVPIPNPLKNGIANAYPVYITVDGSRIPAWHIYPDLPASSLIHPMKKSLKDKSPVVLYLRENGTVDAPKLKSVYQTLSSLGYHIVVPTNIPSQYDVLKVWKWIKAQNNATAYLWGYGMNAADLTVNAKLFCKNLVPPNGVIIAREVKNSYLHQSVEIWSCNCLLPGDGIVNGTELKYNHVKCPITFNNDVNDVYSQIVACIETVNKDVK